MWAEDLGNVVNLVTCVAPQCGAQVAGDLSNHCELDMTQCGIDDAEEVIHSVCNLVIFWCWAEDDGSFLQILCGQMCYISM